MPAAVLIVHLRLPGCVLLKDKRSRIKPLLARLHREFNLAAAELDRQDSHHEAVLGFAALSADSDQNTRLLQQALAFVEKHFADVEVVENHIEIL
jgi:uncharacterized protein YlxP (DUF503 family)